MALESSGLAGRKTLTVDAGGEGTVLLVEVSTTDMLGAWRAARDSLGVTRRWPILVTEPGQGATWEDAFEDGQPFSRFYFVEDHPEAARPSDIMRRATHVDLDELTDKYMREGVPPTDEWLDARLSNARLQTEGICGEAPGNDELRKIYLERGDLALQRHLFRWEIERGCEPPLDYQDWFEPPWPVALAFLPTAEPWSTYAYVHTLYGIDHDLVVAAARRWHERYGAEPVAAWGTITQMLVSTRPREPDEALRLAVQHVVLAPATIGPPGIPLRWHARALLTLDRWLLHSRP